VLVFLYAANGAEVRGVDELGIGKVGPMHEDLPTTLLELECSACAGRFPADQPWRTCPDCGRPLLARYDLDRARRTLTREALRGRVSSLWRYAEVLPVASPEHRLTLGEGWTPLLHLPRLGAAWGLSRLMVKEEGRNPTGTFKARGLCLAVARARELGITRVALPTAGNAGAAAAAYAARGGLRCQVAMPADAPPAIIAEVRAYGADLELVPGLIHDAGRFIAELCRERGDFDLSTLKEPYRAEGKKTMGYELWEQFDGSLPEVVLYPTGGGTGIIGMWKAFAELEAMGLIDGRRPRMIAVQAAGCAPVVRAFEQGAKRCEPWPDAATLAPGIRVPRPFADDLILQSVYQSGGCAVAVDDEAIVAAMHRASREEGVDLAPEGAATLAALGVLVARGEVGADERVVLFNCGTGLKHPELRPQA
jgi:threonine synthase